MAANSTNASAVDSGDLGELLKIIYSQSEIQSQVNLTAPVLGMCAAKGSAALGGSSFHFPVRLASAYGHGYIAEGQALPNGGQTDVQTAKVSPTTHAGVVEITGLAQAVSSQDVGAFARGFDEQMSQTLASMTLYKEGALFRDGTGILGTATVVSTVTLTVDDVAYFRIGMHVDIEDATTAGTWLVQNAVITDIDWTLGMDLATIKCNDSNGVALDFAAAGVAASDKVYIAGSQLASDNAIGAGPVPSATNEPIGFAGALGNVSNSYLEINRATAGNQNWQPTRVNAGSAFFTEDLLLKSRTQLTQATGIQLQTMSSSFKVVTHPAQVDTLFKLAIPRIRYTGGETVDLGNSDEIKFGNMPFVTSHNAPYDQAFMGDWMYFQSLYTPGGELHVDTQYNGSALKWVDNRDMGIAFLKEYCAFACRYPKAFVNIHTLGQPTRA